MGGHAVRADAGGVRMGRWMWMLGLAACGGASAPQAEQGPEEAVDVTAQARLARNTPSASLDGEQLYVEYCALCHGEQGQGYLADNAPMLSNPWLHAMVDDAYLEQAVKMGRPGTPMAPYGSAYGGPLSDAQVRAIVAHMRGWADPSIDLGEPSAATGGSHGRGKEVYDVHCASCHGVEGEGVTGPSLANPVFLRTMPADLVTRTLQHGRPGTAMQSFEGVLTPRQQADVASYIESWKHKRGRRLPPATKPARDMEPVIHAQGEGPELPLRKDRYVASKDVLQALRDGRKMVILDARSTGDYVMYHLPGAVPAPYYSSDEELLRLPKDDTFIVAYCACPHAASGKVVDKLRKLGFEHTAVLDEGVDYWREQGFPGATGPTPFGVKGSAAQAYGP